MLDNKRLVITGVAGALGQATAAKARSQGAHVIGVDIVQSENIPHTDEYYQLDLMDSAATAACFAGLGSIQGLVNIAGGFAMGADSYDNSDEQWDWMFKINVSTLRNAVKAAVPLLKQQEKASIVNIGALGALNGQAAMSAYCCAKSSVMKLTESLSEELKHEGINVNAVLPSIIDTTPNRESMPDADFSQWVSPEQLANVICFLASDAASAVHGSLLPVKNLV